MTTKSAWRLLAPPSFFGLFFEAEPAESPPPPKPDPWATGLPGFDADAWGRGKLADPALVFP